MKIGIILIIVLGIGCSRKHAYVEIMKSDFLDLNIAKLDSSYDGSYAIGTYRLLYKQGKKELIYAIDMSDHGKDNKIILRQGMEIQMLSDSMLVSDYCNKKVKETFKVIGLSDMGRINDTLQALNNRYNISKKDNSW